MNGATSGEKEKMVIVDPEIYEEAERKGAGALPEKKSAPQEQEKDPLLAFKKWIGDLGNEAAADYTRKRTELDAVPGTKPEDRARVAEEGLEILGRDVHTLQEKARGSEFDAILEQALVRSEAMHKLKTAHEAFKKQRAQEKLEEQWFREGEATVKFGGEEARLLELRENLGLEADDVKQLEEVFANASKRETRDLTAELARAIPESDVKNLAEYRDAQDAAKRLAKIEDDLMDTYSIDVDREKTSLAARVRNRLLVGIQRATNKGFRKMYEDYQRLQGDLDARMAKLEDAGIFAGKTRVSRLLDRKLQDIIDGIRNRPKRLRG